MDYSDILAHMYVPQVSTLFGKGGIPYYDRRIVLERLPNELLDKIMEYLDAKDLYLFLFSRQLNPAATRALYLDLKIVVWTPIPPPAGFEKDPEREYIRAAANFRKKMQRIALLVDTADEAEYLFENTEKLSMRLSDQNPFLLTRLCLDIRPSLSHNPWVYSWNDDPLIYHNIDPGVWDRSLAALLLRTPSMRYLDFDWIHRMNWTQQVLSDLTDLRTLKIRGSSDMSDSNETSLFGEGSNLFNAIILSDTPLPDKLEEFILNNITIIGQGELAVLNGNQELKVDFVDCGAKLQTSTQQWFGSWPGFTEARMIFDNRSLKLFNLRMLDNSRHTIRSLEIVYRPNPPPRANPAVALWVWRFYLLLSQIPQLSHLRVSYWMTPVDTSGPSTENPDPLSDNPLKLLTDLDLVLDNSDAHPRKFKDKFRTKLTEILEADCLPALKRIKIIPSHWAAPSTDTQRPWHFQALFVWAHAAWNDKEQSSFCGWTKSSRWLERAGRNDNTLGIYEWGCGIIFDTTASIPFVPDETLEDLKMGRWSVATALAGLSTRCVVL